MSIMNSIECSSVNNKDVLIGDLLTSALQDTSPFDDIP